MGRPRWPQGQVDAVRQHAAAGRTRAATALALGVSCAALDWQARVHHIRFSRPGRPRLPTSPELAVLTAALAAEIAAALAEAPTAPPYRNPFAWPR